MNRVFWLGIIMTILFQVYFGFKSRYNSLKHSFSLKTSLYNRKFTSKRPETVISSLLSPVKTLKGIGEKLQISFSEIGIHTVADLLFHFPINVIDWNEYRQTISDDIIGTQSILLLTVKSMKEGYGKAPTTIFASDEEGREVKLLYFNYGGYLSYTLRSWAKPGKKVMIRGKVQIGFKDGYEIVNPERKDISIMENLYDSDDNSKNNSQNNKDLEVESVYRLVDGISQSTMRKTIANAIETIKELQQSDNDIANDDSNDWLSDSYKKEKGWKSTIESITNIHNPKSSKDLMITTRKHERLAFDELVIKQILNLQRVSIMERKGRSSYSFAVNGPYYLTKYFQSSLPFQLTECQQNAIHEIYQQLSQSERMKHLLQGDVGSGKSVVSFLAMLRTFECGKQSILLAPTEVLASQHYDTFQRFLDTMIQNNKTNTIFQSYPQAKLGYLTGDVKGKERERLLQDIRQGKVDIVIGTHALLSDGIFDIFQDVGLAVIDEEQRFGVEQRNILADRSNVLLTSATPIPRSHIQFLQGAYSVSKLVAKPVHKRPIKTFAHESNKVDDIIMSIERHIIYGTKVFWVCSSLHPVDSYPGTSATERYALLSKKFPNKVGFMHGQMSSEEKVEAMRSFSPRNAPTQILVCTSIIEVGIDVPDVSVCIIDRAGQFGLSQIHQIRGRIGRGPKPDREILDTCQCVLLCDSKTVATATTTTNVESSRSDKNKGNLEKEKENVYDIPILERIKILVESNDGFEIAEKDLELRGPGDVFGYKQSGETKYRVATLPLHSYLLPEATKIAKYLIDQDMLQYNNQNENMNMKSKLSLEKEVVENIIVQDPRFHIMSSLFVDTSKEDLFQTISNSEFIPPPMSSIIKNPLTSISNMNNNNNNQASSVIDRPVETSTITSSLSSSKVMNNKLSYPNMMTDECLLIALDLETTGLNTSSDRIIQMAACVMGNRDERFNAYVYPYKGCQLDPTITKITGITQLFMEKNGQPFGKVWNDFNLWVQKLQQLKQEHIRSLTLPPIVLIAHSGKSYDFKLLHAEIRRLMNDRNTQSSLAIDENNETKVVIDFYWNSRMSLTHSFWLLDTVRLLYDKTIIKEHGLKNNKLATVYEYVTGKPIEGAHNAMVDVLALETIFQSKAFHHQFLQASQSKLFPIGDLKS